MIFDPQDYNASSVPPDKLRKKGDPTPEEIERIVADIVKPPTPEQLTDRERAVAKAKSIYLQVMKQAHEDINGEEKNGKLFTEARWTPRIIEAFRVNFNHHLSKDEMIEVLAVLHAARAIELLR